jgi:pimeloyl-ACP methyl ester carboxylesterase
MDALKIEKADLVTHDIGNMVGYALAAQYPARITKWVIIDAPLPGIGPWDEILKSPLLWHFNFRGADVDRLVKGRERIYFDRFYNELSANPKAIDEATRRHYAWLYARPSNMHYAFEQFAAFNTKDAVDNKAFEAKGKLPMPVLALGADHSFGEKQDVVMRDVASNVEGGIIKNSGHWIVEATGADDRDDREIPRGQMRHCRPRRRNARSIYSANARAVSILVSAQRRVASACTMSWLSIPAARPRS